MKQIIVLDQVSDGTTQTIQFAFWFTVAAGIKPVTANSAWTGASTAENNAIASGTVVEEVHSFSFPVGTPTAAIKPTVQQAWAERNAQLNAVGPHQYYGVFLDSSTGWSA